MGARAINLRGRRFGFLRVIDRSSERAKNGGIHWICLCACGKRKVIDGARLRRGHARSCGCRRGQLVSDAKRHDLTGRQYGLLRVVRRVRTTGRPVWMCECRCGKRKRVKATHLRTGGVKSCGCLVIRRGPDSPSWRGGRWIQDGYVMRRVYDVDGRRRDMKEHRLVMEQKLGRRLRRSETVHHKNGMRHDNRRRNLELWVKVHLPGQRVRDLVRFAKQILRTYGSDKI